MPLTFLRREAGLLVFYLSLYRTVFLVLRPLYARIHYGIPLPPTCPPPSFPQCDASCLTRFLSCPNHHCAVLTPMLLLRPLGCCCSTSRPPLRPVPHLFYTTNCGLLCCYIFVHLAVPCVSPTTKRLPLAYEPDMPTTFTRLPDSLCFFLKYVDTCQ